jgi:hypothetical protein
MISIIYVINFICKLEKTHFFLLYKIFFIRIQISNKFFRELDSLSTASLSTASLSTDRFIDSQFIDRPFYRQPVYRQTVLSTASLSTDRFIDSQFNNDISI